MTTPTLPRRTPGTDPTSPPCRGVPHHGVQLLADRVDPAQHLDRQLADGAVRGAASCRFSTPCCGRSSRVGSLASSCGRPDSSASWPTGWSCGWQQTSRRTDDRHGLAGDHRVVPHDRRRHRGEHLALRRRRRSLATTDRPPDGEPTRAADAHRRARHPVPADRRARRAGGAPGDRRRPRPDPRPLGPRRHRIASPLGVRPVVADRGQPGRNPPRQQPQHAGVPLVRQGGRQGLHVEPARRRRRDRGSPVRRARPPRRRRGRRARTCSPATASTRRSRSAPCSTEAAQPQDGQLLPVGSVRRQPPHRADDRRRMAAKIVDRRRTRRTRRRAPTRSQRDLSDPARRDHDDPARPHRLHAR